MRIEKRIGSTALGGGRGRRLAARLLGVFAILSLSAVLGLSPLLAPVTDATGSPLRRTAVATRARHHALEAYRRDRALDAHRRHARRGTAPRARAAVVGGTLVSIEEVPWQVAIFAEFEVAGNKVSVLCGGSIIDLSHILTAAHCAFDPVTEKPLAPASFVDVAGASTITEKEIKEGATVQVRSVAGVRIQPYFEYASAQGGDDVAVLQLTEPLKATSAVKAIALTSSSSSPPEGTNVSLSGYGEQNPITEELNKKLYSISMTLGFSRKCGGEADALFLCGSNPAGSACNGDSGGGVIEGSPPTLVGVLDTAKGEQRCGHGAVNGFANLTAPEVRDFVEGNPAPPRAPRGGGVVIVGVTAAGHSLSCDPGSWSNAPTFTYAFIDKANGQVLQQGSSSTYVLSEADVGRTIYCEVHATNGGGTGVARTGALPPVNPVAKPPTLTVALAGSGAGSVEGFGESSAEPGFFCPSTCSHSYRPGTTATLFATPAVGSTFAGWGGACTGVGLCAVGMNSDQGVTATFNVAAPSCTAAGCCNASACPNLGGSRIATLQLLSETYSVFAVGASSTPLSGRTAAQRHIGTVFSFSLGQAATVKIAFQTTTLGRRVKGACKPDSPRLRHTPRCSRTKTIATLTRTAHGGLNKVAFSGRIKGKALKPGSYGAGFTALDAAGSSPRRSLSFTIVKR